MRSYEVVRKAIDNVGVKTVASKMKLSSAMVYKWCQQPPKDESLDGSGSRNPLDRVRQIHELTGEDAVIGWLCRHAGGFLVKNPTDHKDIDESVLHVTQSMVKEFSEVLQAVSESVADGKGVDAEEAERIRDEWEELKSVGESFVVACERGVFDKKSR